MSRYDSDSSDGEDEDYTDTGVLLGYASKEPTEDNISQLGGFPVQECICLSELYMVAKDQPDMAGPCNSSTSRSGKVQSL